MKYWKGQNVVCVIPKVIEEHLALAQNRAPKLLVHPRALSWERRPPSPKVIKK